ncbi:19834_t:CDS:2, partial [Racocetra persica]
LRESKPSNSSLGAFQQLLLHIVAKCDISAQKTCYLLLEIEDRLTDLLGSFIKNLENFSNEIDDEDEQPEMNNGKF